MKSKTRNRLFAGIISASMLFSIGFGSIESYSGDTNIISVSASAPSITPFSLSDITMLDPYCTNAFSLELSYLLSFDTNKLLAGFRENAGLSTNGATRYDGWENSLIAGHSVGHYLSAVAQAYCNPSITEKQRTQLKDKISALVDGLKICQQNSKGKPGFIWAAKKGSNGVEGQFDNVENGKTNIITESWVPWYTMHKLITGLNDVYNFVGYQPAKDVGSSLGDWVYNRCKGWSSGTHSKVLSVEYGGMNDCMYELYNITGKESHAIAAHYFDETALHDKVLTGGSNVLNGRHANTTIPKFLGALKRYTILDGKTIEGQKVDASKYLKYAEAFWDNVVTHHTYITGGNSEWEHFGMDDILDKERTNCNCETCNSYNMLKLSKELFAITGDVKYMDYYETTYYNSILSSQNPETGMTTYFQPMATGYFKVYGSPFNNFWCCTGSGMENFTKLGDTIYMKSDNTLYVNLYQSSVVNWKDQNVKITQNSTIPDGNSSNFTIDGSGSLDLRFRIPDWKAGNMVITLNNERYSYQNVNGYAQVKGDFNNGDVIKVTIPEEVKAYALSDVPNAFGFKYGPVVLSAELGTTDMTKGTTGMNVSIPSKQIVSSQKINIKDQKVSLSSFVNNVNDYLVKDANSMKFKMTGTDMALTFTPHYKQYQQRYGIYWYINASGTASADDEPRAKITVTDTVQPGYGQYENDDLHAMDEVNSVGITSDSTYRYAKNGGYFSYRMAVDEDAPYSILSITLRKADNGKTIRISAGDTILYRKTLDYTGKDDIYNVKIIVPSNVISKNVKTVDANSTTYNVITLKFSSDDSKESAKICDFIYMTAVSPVYAYDNDIAYFVDCGDHNTTTLTGSDKLGYYNSLTEQLFKEDSVTGAQWGIIDSAEDKYNGSSKSRGIYTANTWPDENNATDGKSKNSSFRYTKNQYENSIDRHIDYGFTLPNGTYSVEIGFSNPWNCSDKPTVYANYDTDNQQTISKDFTVGGAAMTGKVKVKDGYLSLNFRSESKAINVSYIIIRFLELDSPEIADVKGDVDQNSALNISDAVMMKKYFLGVSELTSQQMTAADMNNDSKVNILDFILLKEALIK